MSNTVCQNNYWNCYVFRQTAKPPLAGLVYIPSNEQLKSAPLVDQLDKNFTRKMVVVPVGQSVKFKNSDAVDHNVFANDRKQNAKFDVGLMNPGGEKDITVDWQENTIVRVGCKIHPKMRTYIATVNTPYYQVLEFSKNSNEYNFKIDNVPENATSVILHIPKYDLIELDFSEDKAWELPIVKKGKTRGTLKVRKVS